MATIQEYVDLIQDELIPLVRNVIAAQQADIERRGEPDPDLTNQTANVQEFLYEVAAAAPAVLDENNTDPLPDVPTDVPEAPADGTEDAPLTDDPNQP